MRIGLAYNQRPTTGRFDRDADSTAAVPSTLLPDTPDAYVEWDDAETIDAVAGALGLFGDVVRLEALGSDFPSRLAAARVDLLFNIAEGVAGAAREAHVPAIAEFLGVPYTASDPLTLALALHKGRAKEVFAQRGIPTAPFVLIESSADAARLRDALPFPLFLKPAWEGSSKGIAEANYVTDPGQAVARARTLLATYRQPVLAETYLPGDEFTVAVLGNGAAMRALPVIRYRFDTLPAGALPVMGFEAKWVWDNREEPIEPLECPARVPDALARAVGDVAVAACRALGVRDWARVDVRLDAAGRPNVVEVNPLPGVIPDPRDNSCFPCAARAAGMSYDALIQEVVRIAWERVTGAPLRQPAEAVA
jgi:D-alanine-D-alanine ligase